jgi:opine dehydrogenase
MVAVGGSTTVAVIGAGNVGVALAGDLTLRGHEVRLCTRSEARLAPIREAGGVTLTGAVEGTANVGVLTTSVAAAVADADVVAVTVPTPALPFYADALAATVPPGALVWLDPGHCGGALFLAERFRRAGRDDVPFCQLSTSSHGARMTAPHAVGVFNLSGAALAAFPGRRLEECLDRVDALLPGQFHGAGSVLELDLMNINAVIHPAPMVGAASWIEATLGDFHFYQEGSGPGICRVIDALDAERLALAAALGQPAVPMAKLMLDAGYTTADAAATGRSHAILQAGERMAAVKAPPGLDHRYLHEDVGWGLVPWLHLAGAVGSPAPTMAALTTLAGLMNGVDYLAAGLTLDQMGLADMTPDEINAFVLDGRTR